MCNIELSIMCFRMFPRPSASIKTEALLLVASKPRGQSEPRNERYEFLEAMTELDKIPIKTEIKNLK